MSLLNQAADQVEQVKSSKGGSKAYIAFDREDEQHDTIITQLDLAAAQHNIRRGPLAVKLIGLALVEAGYLEVNQDGNFASTTPGDEDEDEDASEF